MQVFHIVLDSDSFQDVQCHDREKLPREVWEFCGDSKARFWHSFDFYIRRRSKKRGDFLSWGGGKLVLFPKFLKESPLRPLIESSGELLPITIDKAPALVLNVTPLTPCVDEATSVWDYWQGKRGRLVKADFDTSRVPTGRIFKVPEGTSQDLVAHFPGENRADDFKAIYDQRNYRGLRFRLLWDSEDPNAPVVEF